MDSPAADQVVADVIAAWPPSRANTAPGVTSDGAEARALLHRQLTVAAEPAVDRFWQLLCILGGRPPPPGPRRRDLAIVGQRSTCLWHLR